MSDEFELYENLPSLSEGPYSLTLKCPGCGERQDFPILLSGVLRVAKGGSKLSVRASAKAQDHQC